MRKARISERSAGEVLRLAFPRYRFGMPQQDQSFRLTRDEADAALNELSPYFQAIADLYAGDLDTMEEGRRNEVWTIFDPAASTASLRETSHPGPKANALAVSAGLRTVKRFCLYAHRVVVEDHLFEWLNEYANPPVLHVLGRTDEWLLNGIAFQLALYDALLSLLDDEVVLPMACTPPFLDRSRDQEIASILGGSATRLALNESIISHIKQHHPLDPIIEESRQWSGGVIAGGTQGGFLLHHQRDLKILVNGIMDYCLNSAVHYPQLTVAWEEPRLARVHRYFLEALRVAGTGSRRENPFILTELGTNGAIQPDEISAHDAIRLRSAEPIFADWRETVAECILMLRENYETGEDRERSLREIVREHERNWQRKFQGVLQQSSFLRKVTNPRTSILPISA